MSWFSKFRAKRTKGAPPEAPEPVAGLLSDAGCVRSQNEDAGRIVRAGYGRYGDRGLLLVVADGMGGHEAGEVASNAAVELIEREYRETEGTPGEALEKAFRRANQEILRLASATASLHGMGTTCTALAIVGRQAWFAHVGDSRLYLVRGDTTYQLSEDQTQCMDMVRKGLMTLDEAQRHEDRNVLISAMGTKQALALTGSSESMSVRPGDAFVLCSDGLHDLVTPDEIRETVRSAEPEIACERLVTMAKQRGGPDNITIAVAAIPLNGTRPFDLKPTRECEVRP